VLDVLNAPLFRDLPPNQIVPRLADMKEYVASESTMYRILREEQQLVHREPSQPRVHSRPKERVATGPGQVCSWDISYLRSSVRGRFYYLYMFVDVWSRKIVGWQVHEDESSELAAELFNQICWEQDLDPAGLVLHQDNGGPMKGSTLLATLQTLGVIASFSRPRVSDDNPYSEALFRTLKYRPDYPSKPFNSLEEARAWVERFVSWYNTAHRHSAIRFVTPEQRHTGEDRVLLKNRERVYQLARKRNPKRWSGRTRNWRPPTTVYLNPNRSKEQPSEVKAA
jgi:transposase InsO family protein